jgi:hypothetical protein
MLPPSRLKTPILNILTDLYNPHYIALYGSRVTYGPSVALANPSVSLSAKAAIVFVITVVIRAVTL